MKSKNKLKTLEMRRKQWDNFPESVKRATTRPGSEKK